MVLMCESKNFIPRFSEIFSQRLRIFKQNFTRLFISTEVIIIIINIFVKHHRQSYRGTEFSLFTRILRMNGQGVGRRCCIVLTAFMEGLCLADALVLNATSGLRLQRTLLNTLASPRC